MSSYYMLDIMYSAIPRRLISSKDSLTMNLSAPPEPAMRDRSARTKSLAICGIALVLLLGATMLAKQITLRDRRVQSASTIKYFTWAVDPSEMQVMRKMIARFEALHPGLKVEHITSPGSSYYDKLMTMIAGDSPPDVMYLQPERFAEYVGRGALLNLQPMIAKETVPLHLDDFYPQSLMQFTWHGALHGMPAEAGPMVLFYNRDLFDAAGVPYPNATWDWQRFTDAARKLTQVDAHGRVTQYGIIPFDWQSFVWQNGGEIISADGRHCELNQPAAMEAQQFLADLRHQRLAPPYVERNRTVDEYFKQGKAAMFFCTRYLYTQLESMHNLHWDVSVAPHGRQRATLMIGLGWAIPANTSSPDLAWKFLKFLTSPENLAEMARLGYYFPARRSVADSPAFLTANSTHNDRAFIDSMEYARPLPQTPVYRQMTTIIDDEMALIYLGRRTVPEACNQITRRVDRLLAFKD